MPAYEYVPLMRIQMLIPQGLIQSRLSNPTGVEEKYKYLQSTNGVNSWPAELLQNILTSKREV